MDWGEARMSSKEHWDRVYGTKPATTVSWYQPQATRSLELIGRYAHESSARLIDVGAGASRLADDLLTRGYRDLTLLDLSDAALAVTRVRLGEAADRVRWLVGDITEVVLPAAAYDLWHDRAVFHFLTEPTERSAYRRQLARAVKPSGYVVLATFATDGPSECSGLPVARYAPETLAAELGPHFRLIEHDCESHTTPAGGHQAFLCGVFRKVR